MAIWYLYFVAIFVYFSSFGMLGQEKIWQPCLKGKDLQKAELFNVAYFGLRNANFVLDLFLLQNNFD
jgi:hypothetical protein